MSQNLFLVLHNGRVKKVLSKMSSLCDAQFYTAINTAVVYVSSHLITADYSWLQLITVNVNSTKWLSEVATLVFWIRVLNGQLDIITAYYRWLQVIKRWLSLLTTTTGVLKCTYSI